MIALLDHHHSRRRRRPDSPERTSGELATVELLPPSAFPTFSSDFGNLTHSPPSSIVRPATPQDVALTILLADHHQLTVTPRGNGHSIHGQSLSPSSGIVLDMRSLPHNFELAADGLHADVSGGALWEEVLEWALREHGRAPASWTDYLGLTVGGTLSNAGISGQAFRWGPQAANVAEMEVVDGRGERHVCSPVACGGGGDGDDLFFAVLGGLGQFGVITRARIPLVVAPDMVRWMRVVYWRFEEYAQDAEAVVARPEAEAFDYLEGFAFVNSSDPVNGWPTVRLQSSEDFNAGLVPAGSGPVLYCLEVALHYNRGEEDNVDKRVGEMLGPLRHVRGLEFSTNLSYYDFLTRVKRVEEEARANGSWAVPHPWLNLLVSANNIIDFDRHVFKEILKDGIGGPMLVYPLLKSKWDLRTSVVVPESKVFYLVALLRFGVASAVEEMAAQNRKIIAVCDACGYDYKLYLPHYETEAEWRRHFGLQGWSRFFERKARYDPMCILSPGQKIFAKSRPITVAVVKRREPDN